jgi:hypothetical protein
LADSPRNQPVPGPHDDEPCASIVLAGSSAALWIDKVHYRIHKRLAVVITSSQFNPIHTNKPHLLKYILISLSHLRLDLPSGLFSSHLPTETLNTFLNLSHKCYTSHQPRPILLEVVYNTV